MEPPASPRGAVLCVALALYAGDDRGNRGAGWNPTGICLCGGMAEGTAPAFGAPDPGRDSPVPSVGDFRCYRLRGVCAYQRLRRTTDGARKH